MSVLVSTGEDGKRSAGYSGVQTCGSVWACPVCSAKIAEHRRGEIARALDGWGRVHGGRVALATLTMRHNRGQSLRSLWDGLQAAWHRVTSGRAWEADQLAFGTLESATNRKGQTVMKGRIRWIRVVETTVSKDTSGWHVHIHVLLLLPGDANLRGARALQRSIFDRWAGALTDAGFDAPTRRRGVDVQLLDGDPADALSEYFSKAVYAASFEVARGDLKDARFGNRTPFAVLRDVVATGDADDLDTWHEWERASKGRRQITWSGGTRALLLTEPELSDEEAAALDNAGTPEAQIDRDLWRLIVARRLDYAVLAAFERSTGDGLRFLMGLSPAADRLGARTDDAASTYGRARQRVRVQT